MGWAAARIAALKEPLLNPAVCQGQNQQGREEEETAYPEVGLPGVKPELTTFCPCLSFLISRVERTVPI